MTQEELKERFKQFALAIVQFADALPDIILYRNTKYQLIKSGTSSAANYRAACRRKSGKDFIAKLGIVEEELDETLFWLEFIVGQSNEWRTAIAPLWKEGNELLAITVSSIKTSRKNQKKPPRNP
ncbi:MAG: four helix bundle protein [Lewinellaceae bacterium]|nr:four helix bundle protein [Saprospiraceae bacterium]MCB9317609.1 four helix bundle protein [Lewinellaceae bacterium]MCB9331835.1 four helix bundle protein [Lewinellaceae bacterium]MCB9334391.1 four helix bundle protein [Lewinellaceae bacterium]